MQRKYLIAGNWKLNMNQAQTESFLQDLSADLNSIKNISDIETMVIPPFTSLEKARNIIRAKSLPFKLGAQDLSQYDSGAYTGEISAEMLMEIGVEYVLVGHSERREIFHESDSIINAKLKQALSKGLKVILCCGESEATRDAGATDTWVCNQMESAFRYIDFSNLNLPQNLVVAYEPIWAIGTGKVCQADEANRVISVIRKKLATILGENISDQIRILYGGSVKGSNIDEIIQQTDIDGALVGGASLKKEDILAIIKSTADNVSANKQPA
jgi:triosephosphate isomerase